MGKREDLRMEGASGAGELGQQKLEGGHTAAGGVFWSHPGGSGARTGSAPP